MDSVCFPGGLVIGTVGVCVGALLVCREGLLGATAVGVPFIGRILGLPGLLVRECLQNVGF